MDASVKIELLDFIKQSAGEGAAAGLASKVTPFLGAAFSVPSIVSGLHSGNYLGAAMHAGAAAAGWMGPWGIPASIGLSLLAPADKAAPAQGMGQMEEQTGVSRGTPSAYGIREPRFSFAPHPPQQMVRYASLQDKPNEKRGLAFEFGLDLFCKKANFDAEDKVALYKLLIAENEITPLKKIALLNKIAVKGPNGEELPAPVPAPTPPPTVAPTPAKPGLQPPKVEYNPWNPVNWTEGNLPPGVDPRKARDPNAVGTFGQNITPTIPEKAANTILVRFTR